ncbi:hypothetical protein [Actibacterium lipolyticum]|uniref:Uncharacterized protein n=1 Tax=Actibacterium lipolyticum TaxID=1524263 RepID=A0A238JVA0_9RHOB|nr:hypothetical protein [Actibacterium lipolyticum]SMX34525.1 hypothetical protein COL8621_01353 [Actibacterium lipolyticum]
MKRFFAAIGYFCGSYLIGSLFLLVATILLGRPFAVGGLLVAFIAAYIAGDAFQKRSATRPNRLVSAGLTAVMGAFIIAVPLLRLRILNTLEQPVEMPLWMQSESVFITSFITYFVALQFGFWLGARGIAKRQKAVG